VSVVWQNRCLQCVMTEIEQRLVDIIWFTLRPLTTTTTTTKTAEMWKAMLAILEPVSEHGYFVVSWWRTPLRHPPKLLLTNRFYFQQTSGIHAPVGKRKGFSLSGRSPAPIADCFNVATKARKHSALNLREINRNNKHTALATVWTYYGRVSLIF
jgi:hypothetical protein